MDQLVLDFGNTDNTPLYEVHKGKVELSDLFKAYYACRKNKRKTLNALKFEVNYEENLIQLWEDINNGTYKVGRSIAFVVENPVKREVFAGDFRDRIVHHLLVNKFDHLFEKEFIYDSYSCRKGKGTLFGVKRLNRFIRACSENYTRDCYVLKMDIQGFFMSIRRDILFENLYQLIGPNYHEPDRDILLNLVKDVVMNDCTENCIIKSSYKKWDDLPTSKSLFGQNKNKGIPIGNLTSQVFGNFYLTLFDHFVKNELGMTYYGRYVDDFFIVHTDKNYLKKLVFFIRNFLEEKLELILHPKKTQLQHYTKGVKFVGGYVMPGRIYVDRRTKGNMYKVIAYWNRRVKHSKQRLSNNEKCNLQASINSYLGFMRHYKTYKLRKRSLFRMSAKLEQYVHPAKQYTKIVSIASAIKY